MFIAKVMDTQPKALCVCLTWSVLFSTVPIITLELTTTETQEHDTDPPEKHEACGIPDTRNT